MGIVFQSFNLIPSLNALENVLVPLRADGVPMGEARRRAAALLERVGLGNRLKHRPSEMSGGQMQRVAIARAIVTRPSIVLADEPTANLDSKTAQQIMDLLIEINEHYKTTFIFSTHDEKLINHVRRVVRMEDGTIV